MHEQAYTPTNLLTPGQTFEYHHTTELAAFENMVVATVKPELSQRDELQQLGWIALKELVRPPAFHGTITDLRLTVMERPLEELLTARENKVRFSKFGPMSLRSMSANNFSLQGFELTANGTSTGRGKRAIHAQLWYLMQGSLRRIATQPELQAAEPSQTKTTKASSYRLGPPALVDLRIY